MEIIHVILGKANPDRMNGVNKVVNSLATYQSRLGYAVSIWGITSNMEVNYPRRNYTTVLFPANKNKLFLCPILKISVDKISRGTIFHIHGGFIPEFFHFSRKLVDAGISYIFTPHGAYNIKAMQKNKWMKKVYFSIFDKYVINNAKALHCIGESETDIFHMKNMDVNSVLIPNGQNIEDLKYDFKSIEHTHSPVFGFCGRIDIETKGLDLLFKGFAHYRHRRNKKGELWIIGDGPKIQSLKNLAKKLKIIEDVRFWGKRFGQDKLNIMANMDAFYHASRNEGLPGAVLEAAGLKVPCVVSKESNMANYVKRYNAGIGLRINNIDYISKSMVDISNHYDTDSLGILGENALKMVKETFNWNKIAKQLVDVYHS